MLKLIAVFLALCAVALAQDQTWVIADNVTDVCNPSCDWSTSHRIWKNNAVYGELPSRGAIVTLASESSSNFVLNIDQDVAIASLVLGFERRPTAGYTINVKSGYTLTIGYLEGTPSGPFTIWPSATLNIENNASVLVGGGVQARGQVTVGGTFRLFGSDNINIESTTYVNPTNPTQYNKRAVFTLAGGNLILGSPTATVTQTGTITGAGNITGTIQVAGDIKPGADNAIPADIYINGNLRLTSTATSTFNIKSKTEFDHIYLTGSITCDGTLIMSPIGDFEPVSGSRFFIMNHTEFINGFDTVRGDGFIRSIFNNDWSIRPDQENTIIVYGSAATTVASVAVVVMCLIASML